MYIKLILDIKHPCAQNFEMLNSLSDKIKCEGNKYTFSFPTFNYTMTWRVENKLIINSCSYADVIRIKSCSKSILCNVIFIARYSYKFYSNLHQEIGAARQGPYKYWIERLLLIILVYHKYYHSQRDGCYSLKCMDMYVHVLIDW